MPATSALNCAPAFPNIRILEIGDYRDLKDCFPKQTQLLWTGARSAPSGALECSPGNLWRAFRDIRKGKYDILVVRPPHHTPCHPRQWLRSILRTPTKPLTAAFRVFGVQFLRFCSIPIKIVAIDKSDSFGINRHNFFLLDRVAVYFKRELAADKWQTFYKTAHPDLPGLRIRSNPRWQRRVKKLQPIAIGVARTEIARLSQTKSTDIFYAGNAVENSSIRAQGLSEMQALASIGYKVDIPDERLSHEDYLRRMAQAWLAWSPAGFGWECYRHYEALQCLTVPIINYPTIQRHRPLLDGVHGYFYSPEPGELSRTVKHALTDKTKLTGMAAAGRDFVCTHHTHDAIYREIIEIALNGQKDVLVDSASKI